MSGETAIAASGVSKSFGWVIEGDQVWVEKNSRFPEIDPFTGETGVPMTLNEVKVRYRPDWLTFSICVLIVVLSFWIRGGLLGIILTLFAIGVVGMFFPKCTLEMASTKNLEGMQATQEIAIGMGFFLAAAVAIRLIENVMFFDYDYGAGWMPPVAIVLLVLGSVWLHYSKSRLTCRRRKDGRFEIRGFHPRALELLALAQQNRTLPCNEVPTPEDQQTDRSHGTRL